MPTLNWIGKDKIITHHNDVPFKLLEKKYSYGSKESNNMIIHGDNLYALKSLLPRFEGRIDCIYIDPPYNTGEEKWIYNDNVNDPRILKWLGEVVGKEGEDLSRHDKWLCMMYPRLKLLQKLLKSEGRIFISIDENELYSLKLICDEIFGINNFSGQWMWYKSATPPNLSHKIKRNLEYILCYEKEKNSIKFSGIKKHSSSDDPFTKPQNSFKKLTFKIGSVHFKGTDGIYPAGVYGTAKFPNRLLNDLIIENGVNSNEVTFENRFIWVQETLDKNLQSNIRVNLSKNLVLSYKREEYDAEVPPNLIDDTVGVNTTEEAGKRLKEMFGENPFDYPKDCSLIKYLINFVPNKNAIILDCFAGSGTTGQAVLELNSEDGGNRRFIEVEMMDYAETITAERIRKITTGFDDYVPIKGDFSFYELGESIFLDDGNLNPAISEEDVKKFIYYTETHKNFEKTENDAYMGSHDSTAYYIFYKKNEPTVLNYQTIDLVNKKADAYVIYADTCTLSKNFMEKNHIIFKKIPRDIQKI